MRLIVLPGDGIGPEITAATLAVLRATSARFALGLEIVEDVVGHASLARHGTTVRADLLDLVRASDGLMLGPTATYDFRDEARGEINPSRHFRKNLDLYANIRPAKTWPGLPGRAGPFDLVVVRENTEGFYADRNMAAGNGELLVTPDVVVSLRRITRQCCERIAESALRLARSRRQHVTLVHKANVLRIGDGMFLEACRTVAKDYPDVTVDDVIVDAMMAHLVRAPERFDVICTTNMFGDILSDLTAELSGSLGMGGALNAGHDVAMAQAAHGSAPDIAGRDIANPFALIVSAAMLLAWHGERAQSAPFSAAAAAIDAALADAVAAGETTRDIGGALGTAEVGRKLAAHVALGA
jgi:3-isopropylmalate dehydrogenase